MSDHEVPPYPPHLAVVDETDGRSDEFKEVVEFLEDRPRCGAKTASGAPCGLPVIALGATVCRVHGGAAPHVREAAVTRLRTARDEALDRLVEMISSAGDRMDPRVLLDVVTKLTAQVELLEGRATARTESSEFKIEEIRATFNHRLDALADSYKRAPTVLEMVDRMMGEGEFAEAEIVEEDAEAADG